MRFNYNHVLLVGRLTKDPEFKQVNESFCKLQFSLAINRRRPKDAESLETDFIPICLFGKMASIGQQLLTKGCPVLVWGRIQVRHYEKNEERRWITEVMADNFQLLKSSPGPSPTERLVTEKPNVISESLCVTAD